MALKEQAKFFSQFVLKPGIVGAVLPSSNRLASKMVEWIDWPNVRTVVEYGPGTGVFTKHILARMHPKTRLIGIEINPCFAAAMEGRFPQVPVYRESVKNVKAVCQEAGIAEVDAIVSGLPWASFPGNDQDDYLGAMMTVLKPGGQFTTFAYLQGLLLPAGRRFKNKLREYFCRVELSNTVWMNFPPAFVYRCRR